MARILTFGAIFGLKREACSIYSGREWSTIPAHPEPGTSRRKMWEPEFHPRKDNFNKVPIRVKLPFLSFLEKESTWEIHYITSVNLLRRGGRRKKGYSTQRPVGKGKFYPAWLITGVECNLLSIASSITGIEWMSAHEFPLSNHLISYSGHWKLKSKDIKA